MTTDAKTAEVGIRRAILIETREGLKKSPRSLGFAQINYGRLFVRDYWTLFALARENDCKIEDFLPEAEKRSGPRWSELISASEDILDEVRSLPVERRILVLLRGSGLSWRKIQLRHPERAIFSLKDDHLAGVSVVARRKEDPLNFLASYENFFVVRRAEAA